MQRTHTELLACSFQHVNMKQRGCCSTSEQDWSPCCSFYWMCCITDSQLMKWVSVTLMSSSLNSWEGRSLWKVSVKTTVCVDGGWAVSWGSRGWSSSSLCVSLQFTQPLNLHVFVRWSRSTWRKHRENMQTPHRKTPPEPDSNQQPSCPDCVLFTWRMCFLKWTQHKQKYINPL